jgi:uncharacterized protein YjbI with pentapeptide repeats
MNTPAPRSGNPFADELIEGKTFLDIDVRGCDIPEKIFRDCTFSNVSLAEARLHDCRFEDCTVKASDWTMVKV